MDLNVLINSMPITIKMQTLSNTKVRIVGYKKYNCFQKLILLEQNQIRVWAVVNEINYYKLN